MSGADDWAFSENELLDFLTPESIEKADNDAPLDIELSDTFDEIGGMCRRIAAQYIDVVASFAALHFQAKDTLQALEVAGSVSTALERLGSASDDQRLVGIGSNLNEIVSTFSEQGRRHIQQQRIALRTWLEEFADYLPEQESTKIQELIRYDFRTQPLLKELSQIKGIGKRRLQSLHLAGLYAVEVLSASDPAEVASVTGMPAGLAAKVVAASRDYAEQERRDTVETLRRMVSQFANSVRDQGLSSDQDAALIALAKESLLELQTALSNGNSK